MDPSPSIRVAVVSDDRLFSDGLVRFLNEHPGVAGQACVAVDLSSLSDLAAAHDIVLLDARSRLGSARREVLPASGAVIFVGAVEDDAWASAALSAGARGILTRTSELEDVMAAIRVVRDGGIWARRRWLNACVLDVVGASRRRVIARDDLAERLSPREQDVLRFAAAGLSNKELADRLSISEATVKVHLTRIFQKLQVGSRAALAAAYHGVARADAGSRQPAAGSWQLAAVTVAHPAPARLRARSRRPCGDSPQRPGADRRES